MDLDYLQAALAKRGISAKLRPNSERYSRHVEVKLSGGSELRVRAYQSGHRWSFNDEESFRGDLGQVITQIERRLPLSKGGES